MGRSSLRVFLGGHALSSMGGKMQAAALLWHIYELTGSALALGALGAIELVPMVAFAAIGGVTADRHDRRRVLAIAQAAQALPALVLAGLTFCGLDSVGAIYAAAAAAAAVVAFDTAARKSLVPRLVEPDRLAGAMSAMDLVKNVAKLAGPAVMGIVVASAGLAWIYLANAITFGAMIVALAILPRAVGERDAASEPPAGFVRPFVEGLRFVRATPIVGSLIALDVVATFFAGAEALLPMVAREVLGVGPTGYGLLASAGAAGALVGGALLLAASPRARLGRLVLASVAVFGLATVAFGLSRSFVACFIALAVLGAADTVSTVMRNTLLQLRTPDGLRGRITAVNLVFAKSGPRLGQLEAGLVAAWLGLTTSIVSGGVLCVAAAGWMAWRHPWLRRLDTG